MMKIFIIFGLLLSMISCSGPLSKGDLKELITLKLANGFGQDTFLVEDFQQRGSYHYKPLGSSDEKVLLYYRAKLRFNRDYMLSDWEKPNVGSLTYLLGANPQGIVGIALSGNKKNDVLTIRGAINFKKDSGKWVEDIPIFTAKSMNVAAPVLYNSEADRQEVGKNSADYRQSINVLQSIFSSWDKDNNQQAVKASEKVLFDMTQKALMYQAKQQGYLTLASGVALGNYHELGRAFSKVFGKKIKLKSFASSGSVENCQLLEEGKADFAIVQSDIAVQAFKGEGVFGGSLPMNRLRAVAALYPEAVMVIVHQKSSIQKIGDLKGKSIGVGLKGSGNRADAIQLIRAHGLNQGDFGNIEELSYDESFDLFEKNKIDALFITAALPLPSLVALSEKVPLRFLPIAKNIQSKLHKSVGWIPLQIPAQIFKGVEKPVSTMGVSAVLLSQDQVGADKVQSILSALYSNGDELVKQNALAGQITRRNATRGTAIPLHLSARDYFKTH